MLQVGIGLGFLAGLAIRLHFSNLEQERKQFYFNAKALSETTPHYGFFFVKQFLEILVVEAVFFGFWALLLGSWSIWPNNLILYLIYWSVVQFRKSEERVKISLEHLPIFIELFLSQTQSLELHQGWILGNLSAWIFYFVYIHRNGLLPVPKVVVPPDQTLRGQLEKMTKNM